MKPLLPRRLAICAPILAVLLITGPTAAFAGDGAASDDAAASAMSAAAQSADADRDAALLEAGKLVFTEEAVPNCTICHTLADAEATGQVGPDLDELQPTLEQVRQAVAGGVGIMPAYGNQLTDEQIEAVAHYVSTVTAEDP